MPYPHGNKCNLLVATRRSPSAARRESRRDARKVRLNDSTGRAETRVMDGVCAARSVTRLVASGRMWTAARP
jgi:hypothetical protein